MRSLHFCRSYFLDLINTFSCSSFTGTTGATEVGAMEFPGDVPTFLLFSAERVNVMCIIRKILKLYKTPSREKFSHSNALKLVRYIQEGTYSGLT